ncbi:uncharacterized protein LOC123878448 [Maniola jurtina]|uniref:uncharacterized protein LOC123878448 n=1 Tax=Maniola jurtina TaxID=191418 RepID=UPI001E68D189|nr:uncharacterized protein LOC123878448 [Maniola jurtina]
MDTDDAIYDDPGIPTGTDRSPNVDPGLNTEHTTLTELRYCVNCGTDVTQRRRHSLELVEVMSVIRHWIAPQAVTDSTIVCHSCWTLALNQSHHSTTTNDDQPSTSGGHHRRVCISCGCSLMRTRSHRLRTDTEREARIRNIIMERIMPRQLHGSDEICHPCWQRSDRLSSRTLEPPQQGASTIILPNLKRAVDTQAHCFFPDCNLLERLTVPKWLRVKLFADFKFYVPPNCRICTFHLQNDNWQQLEDIAQPIQSFTTDHIEDFASFINERATMLDFSNIDDMSEDFVHFWVGLTKSQFRQLIFDVPSLRNMQKGSIALAAYLVKLRTGDSDERLATLFNMPRTTLLRYMNKARNALKQDFVTRNLGINNITRAEIAARNLLIPNGLFCAEDRKPIVIMDGTYLYVQKSSNYMYQKDTYSLHKYRNLMKPFIIVCCDGYIVDVIGPYPATTSDANIMSNEFSDETKPLRQYFQPGDIFILDRGFRDCLPLLEQNNYSVHTPASLQEGENQLSTLAANQSRMVTICRWVVEAVNSIFKQSFKLLRHEFFNVASRHAMTDFTVAAALINKFHQRIRDRDDASQILEIINEKLYMNNDLADYVIRNNLNRRRTQFLNINVDINNVPFPRLELSDLILIACGTYQLKQARSYYGEHIRGDGSYTKVCRDMAGNLLEGFTVTENSSLLRVTVHFKPKPPYKVDSLLSTNIRRRSVLW